jgi:DNA-binding response OmpR family regulator
MKLKLNFDLSFEEDGVESQTKLTLAEKRILEELVKNEGQITREKIADFKWGEGSYDEFSDQAINKAVKRLNVKLTKYRLKAILGVGYKAVRR